MFFKKIKLLNLRVDELIQTKYELEKIINQNGKQIQKQKEEIDQYKFKTEEIRGINETFVSKYSRFIEHEHLFEHEKRKLEELNQSIYLLNEKYEKGLSIYNQLEKDIKIFQESVDFHEYGIYEPIFNFDTSEKFKETIKENIQNQKRLIAEDKAIVLRNYPSNEIVDLDAVTKYEKSEFIEVKKLVLYAFNAGCDSIISKVNWRNIDLCIDRIYTHYHRIFKYSLGLHHYNHLISNKFAFWHLTQEFLELKITELQLTHEYQLKKYEEKEEQKRIREQIREEEKALRDYEKAEREAEEEERYLNKALAKVKQKFGYVTSDEIDALNNKVRELEAQIKEAQEKKARAIALAQTTKVGYIYVISNIGSLGEDIYKIGMTRRLDPQDRVDELSNASVPFRFDIHAVIFSENAPQLEYELHQKFNDRRINRVNRRKEFFNVKLDEIEIFVKEHANAEIEFTKIAEAREYRETVTLMKSINSIDEHIKIDSKFPKNLFD